MNQCIDHGRAKARSLKQQLTLLLCNSQQVNTGEVNLLLHYHSGILPIATPDVTAWVCGIVINNLPIDFC